MTGSVNETLSLLAQFVLPDGSRWGETAAPFQWACARCLLDPSQRPFRWESRPRGGRKSTDAGGIAAAMMLTQLPPGATVDLYAADRDQARLVLDALAGMARRTPELGGALVVDQHRARTTSGVVLEVLAADAASAYGRTPYFAVADELCQWPSTANARTLWEVIFSSMTKADGARLMVASTAGDPVHFSRKIFDAATKSPLWTVSEVPGPLSWLDPVQVDEQRRMLTESAFARLVENRWSAAEDRLVSEDDLAACVTLDGPQAPIPGAQYVIGLDLGLKKDRAVAAVCHAEPIPGRDGRMVVLDRLQVWQGSRRRPVQFAEVEGWLLEAHQRYNRARLITDPWQAANTLQRLAAKGVSVEEFNFSTASHGRLASALLLALREHRMALPDDEALLDELASVRLRESVPGVPRIDHDSGRHDDRVIALGLCVLNLPQAHVSAIVFCDDEAPVADLAGQPFFEALGPFAIDPAFTFRAALRPGAPADHPGSLY